MLILDGLLLQSLLELENTVACHLIKTLNTARFLEKQNMNILNIYNKRCTSFERIVLCSFSADTDITFLSALLMEKLVSTEVPRTKHRGWQGSICKHDNYIAPFIVHLFSTFSVIGINILEDLCQNDSKGWPNFDLKL